MRKQDYGAIGLLIALAGYIWLRDLSWLDAPDDTLPILAALPLFVWLKRPWTFSSRTEIFEPRLLLAGTFLFAIGALIDSELLLAASWTAFLSSWLAARTTGGIDPSVRRLLVLPLLSFPWISTDFQRLGWWFRLSGAWAAEKVLSWGHFEASRRGTDLMVGGFSLGVEPACSGLNGLEAMLIAGAVMAWMKFRRSPLFWWNAPFLVAAAWGANLCRIVFAARCGVALKGGLFYDWFGPLHLLGGWLALCAMFGLCWLLFSLEARLASRPAGTVVRWLLGRPWLEIIILVYCLWRCDDLFSAWRHSPYDRLGWLAFLVWLRPLKEFWRAGGVLAARSKTGICLLSAGLALVFMGDLGDLNLFRDLGLAAVLLSFASRRFSVIWTASAVAWLPASGWIGSLLGLHPILFSSARVLLAALATTWLLRASKPRKPQAQRISSAELLPPARQIQPLP